MIKPKKNEETDKVKITSIIVFGVIISIVILGLVLMLLTRVDATIDCKLDNIRLVDVRPATCYADFNNEFCPVPQNIQCKIEAKNVPVFLL